MTRGEISDDDNDVRVPELGVFFLSVSFFPHKLCTVRVRTPYTVSVNDGPLLFPTVKKKNKAQYTCGFLVRIELGVYFFSSPTSSPSHSLYIHMPKIGGERVSFPGRGDDDDVVFIGVVVQGFATVVEKVGREHRGTNS